MRGDTEGMVRTMSFSDVALCRAGTWNGLTGKAKITPEDLQSVVDAYSDQEIDKPRVKIGHVSSLNTALGDGAPAFGWVQNPRMDPDGVTLRGDLVDIPRQLGEIVGRAYKDVSVELRKNVTTPSGKKHRTVLSGLALLGASAPAVKGLDDLVSLYASESPDNGPEDECSQSDMVTISLGDALNASDTDPTVPDVSPVAGDDDTDSPEPPGAETEGEPTVAFLDQAREKLGLAKDATEDEILTALSEDPADPDTQVKAQETDVTGDPDVKEPELKSVEAKSPETVTVSKAQWDDVTAQLKDLTDKAEVEHQEKVLEAALSEGRIVPSEREQWVTALSEAPEATEVLLSKLARRVNMSEHGSDVALSAGDQSDEDTTAAAYATRARLGL